MDMSRVSTCTIPMHDKEIDHALQVVAEAGFAKADILGRLPHFSQDQSLCDWPRLRDLSSRLGVAIANLGSYPGQFFTAESEPQRQADLARLKATVEAAVYLGARSIRVMPGRGEDPTVVDTVTPYFIEAAAYTAERGIYMGIENHAGSIAGHPELALQLCRNVGSSYFGVLYEPCNLLFGGVDYRDALEVFGDWLTHCHIKDGTVRDGKPHKMQLGEGDVDFVWVVEQLEAAGYRGDYALEYELSDVEPPESGIKRWHDTFVAAFA